MIRNQWRRLVGRVFQGSRGRRPMAGRTGPALRIQELEDRSVPATFIPSGSQLTLGFTTDNSSITATTDGSTYTFVLAGDTWTGTDTTNFTGNNTNTLTVTAAGVAAITDVVVNENTSTVANSTFLFGPSFGSFSDNITVNLANTSSGQISFSGTTSFSGSSFLNASTTNGISVPSGATVQVANGGLTLSANPAGTTSVFASSIAAVHINGGTVKSTGSGDIQISGKGIASTIGAWGVGLIGGGQILSTANAGGGKITIDSWGGFASGGSNVGIFVGGSGSVISSNSGAIKVSGTGGTGFTPYGVSLFNGGQINGLGSATVTVIGKGGSDNAAFGTVGVAIDNAAAGTTTKISSVDGLLSITGTGSATSSDVSFGIVIDGGGQAVTTGTAALSLDGTGGNGTGKTNSGILLNNGSVASKGVITILATAGSDVPNTSYGLSLLGTSTITQSGSNPVSISADSVNIAGTASINAGTQTVSIAPRTSGASISLGGVDTSTILGLTNAELNRITAGTIAIGNGTSGDIDLLASLTITPSLSLTAPSGKLIRLSGQISTAASANAGSVTINGAATLFGNVTILTDSTGTDGGINFATGSTINGVLGTDTLTLTAGTGNVVLNNTTIGATTSVAGLSVTAGNLTGSGAITVNGPLSTAVSGSSSLLSGAISGTLTSFSVSGGGTIALTSTGNNFTGDIQVTGAGTTLQASNFSAGEVIPNGSSINLAFGTKLSLLGSPGSTETIAGLTGTGTVNYAGFATQTLILTPSGTNTFDGAITNTAGTLGVTMGGTGKLVLTGNNSYGSFTTVNSGTLLINGTNSGTGLVSVNNSATLGGTGSIAGQVQINGTARLAPGASPETLATGALTFATGTFFDVEIGGTSPGNGTTGYDQVNVTGAVVLNNATLNLIQFGGFSVDNTVQQAYTIITNDGSDAVTGTFLNLPEGSPISYAGGTLYISYAGGTGNDVVLYSQPVVNGSASGDTLVLRQFSGTQIEFSLNGAAFVQVTNTLPFTFNGQGGSDMLWVDTSNGDPIPTGNVAYTNGELLRIQKVTGPAADTVTFTSTATTITGYGSVNYTSLGGADFVNLTQVNLQTANLDDTIILSDNGTLVIAGSVPAGYSTANLPTLYVSGSGLDIGLNSIGTANLSTVTGGGDGTDTITVLSGTGAFDVTNLNIDTGSGTDSVIFTGSATFAGDVQILSQNIAFNGGTLTTTGGTSKVTLNAGTGAITTNGTGLDVSTPTLLASATTGITLDTTVTDLTADNSGAGSVLIRETDGANVVSATSTGGNVQVQTATGALNVTTANSSGTVTLIASGAGGAITDANAGSMNVQANSLSITTAGGVNLDTTIANLDISSNGLTTIREANGVSLGTINVGANTFDLATSATGAVTQTGTITASNFRLQVAGGGANLGGANAVGTLATNVTGALTFNNNQNLTIGTVTTVGVSASGTIGITVNGNLTVTDPVTSSGSSVTLTANKTTGSTININNTVNGTAATVNGGTGADQIFVTRLGTVVDLTLDGQGANDQYQITYGNLSASKRVVLSDSGVTNGDKATFVGATGANIFNVNTDGTNVPAPVGGTTPNSPGTVQIGSERTFYANGGIETLILQGNNSGSTYNVYYQNSSITNSQLAPVVQLVSGTGTDIANLVGTDNPDTFDVNVATLARVTVGTENVDYSASLETLNVFGKNETGLTGDSITARPDVNTAINVYGGTPVYPTSPGDTLQLVLINPGNPSLNVSNPVISKPAFPDGNLTSSSHKTVTWQSIETLPVPLGLGGTFDFGAAGAALQPGFRASTNDLWASGTFAGIYGWNAQPGTFNRVGDQNFPIITTGGYAPSVKLMQDGMWNFTGKQTFSVAVGKSQLSNVTLFIGDTARNYVGLKIYFDGVLQGTLDTPVNTLVAFTKQYTTNSTGKIDVSIEMPFASQYWILNGLDVRPISLVVPLTVTRTDAALGSVPQLADGLTVDSYTVVGAQANQLLTVNTTLGTVLTSQDADLYMQGVQVYADSTGKATFQIQRPTGIGPATVSVVGAYGDASSNYDVIASQTSSPPSVDFVQTYVLPDIRKIDLGNGPVASGYLGLDPSQLYSSTSANAIGFVGIASTPFDRGGANALLRDGGSSGAGSFRDLRIDLPSTGNDTYYVTMDFGDAVLSQAGVTVSAVAGQILTPLTLPYVNPVSISAGAGETKSITFPVKTNGLGNLTLRIDTPAGYWSLQGIEVRKTVAPITISRIGANPAADGSTVTTYQGTGAVANSTVTVAVSQGKLTGVSTTNGGFTADQSNTYTGVQAIADGTGTFFFQVQSPTSSTTLTSDFGAVDVTGAASGAFLETYSAATPATTALRFDFNGAGNKTQAGFTGVRGSEIYDPAKGYGWSFPVADFERTSATSLPAAQNLVIDGVWGYGATQAVFKVAVAPGSDIFARVTLGDSFGAYSGITLLGEGQGLAKVVSTQRDTYSTYILGGKDINGDGIYEFKVSSNQGMYGYWVLNSLEIATTSPTNLAPATAITTTNAVGATSKFDFDTATSPTAGGYTSITGSTIFNTTSGGGWTSAVNSFDRGAGSGGALFQDGAWGYGPTPSVFRVAVPVNTQNSTQANVTAYVGDSFAGYTGIEFQLEGQSGWTTVNTTKAVYNSFPLGTGTDSNNDGWLDILVRNVNSYWIFNGVDVTTL